MIRPLVAPLLRRSIRSSLRRDLAGVWLRGPLPVGGAVLAPNHHSWWDAYLLGEVAASLGQDCRFLMTQRQLSRFPFLREVGAVDERSLRILVRAARGGAWVVVFPEGAIRPAGELRGVQAGAAWLAQRAGVPLVPVALRVLMRGSQWPEAFVRFGATCPADTLAERLNTLLAALDQDLRDTDPDLAPDGYLRWVQGRASRHERVDLASRLLIRLGGFEEQS